MVERGRWLLKDQSIAYTDDSIHILEGLDAVRKRPGMYIGSTDKRGLHHLVYEIVDNAVDEALSGFGDEITVTIHKDNSISVEDKGRGIPTGMHRIRENRRRKSFLLSYMPAENLDKVDIKRVAACTELEPAVVNALSEWLEVTIYRDGQIFFQRFEKGGKPRFYVRKE